MKFGGFFPESYPVECGAYSLYYYAANDNEFADQLIGCKDGYIRKYSDSSKNDSTGASSTDPISSYVVLPLIHLAEDNDDEGKLTSLTFELGGGASGGDFGDTDAVTYEIFTGNDPETVLEDIKDGATPFATGTLTGTGRKTRIRTRVRGAYIGIKLSNVTAAQTWVLNRVYGNIVEAGKIRG